MKTALVIVAVLAMAGIHCELQAQTVCGNDEFLVAYKQARESEFKYLDGLSEAQLAKVHQFYASAASATANQILLKDDSDSEYIPSLSNTSNLQTVMAAQETSEVTAGALGVLGSYILTFDDPSVLARAIEQFETLEHASSPYRIISVSEVNDLKYRAIVRAHLQSLGCSSDLTADYALPPHSAPQTKFCEKSPSSCQ